jgi:hypothetical protein
VEAQLSRLSDAARHPDKQHLVRGAVFDILKTCNYNAAALVPFYFPRSAARDGSAMAVMDRPYAIPFLDMRKGQELTMLTGRQVGKSTSLILRNRIMSDIVSDYSTLYVAPHPMHLATFVNRFKKMKTFMRYSIEDRRFRQNLKLMEEPNGSITEMVHALDDATALRGKSADEVDVDEFQSFNPDHMYEIKQVLRASDYKNQLCTGTALGLDNPLALRYNDGSQGRWMIQCALGHWTNMGEPKEILRSILPEGMFCPHCRAKGRFVRVNPLAGFYDHAYPERAEEGNVSLHAPQLIVPSYVLDPAEWLVIYEDFKSYPEPRFLQEVCGIPTESAARELTRQDLIDICSDEFGDVATRRDRAKSGYYKWVISGCDWGGADHQEGSKIKQSYTHHCIIGMTHSGRVDILYYKQYSGMEYEDIAAKICLVHKEFRAQAMASDFGVGMAYNMLVRKHIPADRHFVLSLVGPNTAPFKTPEHDHMYNQFSLNKTEALSTLILAVKSARIRCYGWGEAEPDLLQFLNTARVPVDRENSSLFKYIRHGTQPDDAMMATSFAYALLRVITNEGIVVDPSLHAEVLRNINLSGQIAGAVRGYPDDSGYMGL